ncbi:MAG TPA: PAS domain S-box protein [Candidatus Nanoarchaeia archaeon]|nr:PAS domain S-box protein [Candidatus Nanoarchaeia archaeon]
MHKTIERQLRKYLEKDALKAKGIKEFLKAVSDTYQHYDEDRQLLENSLMLTSKELNERYEKIKKTEEDLKLFRNLMDSSDDSIFIADPVSGSFLDVNNKACFVLGYEKSELLKMKVWDIDMAIEGMENWKRLGEELKSKSNLVFQGIQRTKKGGMIPVEVSVTHASYGNKSYNLAVSRNITERKKQEEKLNELTNRLKLVLDSTDQGIYGTDLQGNCTLINKAALRITGLSENEVMGKSAHGLFHYKKSDGTPYPISECPIIRTLKTGEGTKMDSEFFWKKDGSAFAVEYSSYPIVENKEIKGIVVAFADITKRKEAEMEITKLSKAVELSPDNIVITDKMGNIQYVNEAFERLTGYSKEDVIGKNPRILKSGSHDEVFYKKMWEVILSGNNFSGQFANKKKNGEFYYEDKIIFPIKDQNGNIVNFVSSGKDATERKIAEDKIKEKTSQLERFNKIAVGRELRMIELKKKIRELESRIITNHPSEAILDENNILGEAPKH